jgi:hypothetical protein
MLRKILGVCALACGVAVVALAASAPAEAHRSRFFFGLNYNCCWGPPVYYAPPPYYYYPPPVAYVAPPPAVYYPPAPVAAPAPANYCREYRGDATIDGSGQPFYGRACLQPDGRWHIVN